MKIKMMKPSRIRKLVKEKMEEKKYKHLYRAFVDVARDINWASGTVEQYYYKKNLHKPIKEGKK